MIAAPVFAELLKRLEKADPETFILLDGISRVLHGFDLKENPNERIINHIIQGEIQRSCERRGWYWQIAHGSCTGYMATVRAGKLFYGDSSAGALLAAYLSAIKGASQA